MYFIWAGNGGYGRLGHKEQKDEFSPKKVEVLSGRMPVDADSPVSFAHCPAERLCCFLQLSTQQRQR